MLSLDYGTCLMPISSKWEPKYNFNILKMTVHLNFYSILLIKRVKLYQNSSFMPI